MTVGPSLFKTAHRAPGGAVAKDRKRPLLRKLSFRKLQRKRVAKARVLVELVDGREVTLDRNLRACR